MARAGVGYGTSLVLFVLALRLLGSARTGAYFSTAPFMGAIAAAVALREPLSARTLLAAILMGTDCDRRAAPPRPRPRAAPSQPPALPGPAPPPPSLTGPAAGGGRSYRGHVRLVQEHAPSELSRSTSHVSQTYCSDHVHVSRASTSDRLRPGSSATPFIEMLTAP
jgi:hypothetical protein